MENVVWYLLAGTRGGETRARILWTLKRHPQNANQLAKTLTLDYKTIQHHLELLIDHRVLVSHGRYGAVYFVSDEMKRMWDNFEEMWDQFGREFGKTR